MPTNSSHIKAKITKATQGRQQIHAAAREKPQINLFDPENYEFEPKAKFLVKENYFFRCFANIK